MSVEHVLRMVKINLVKIRSLVVKKQKNYIT